jgi:hypothetical protein
MIGRKVSSVKGGKVKGFKKAGGNISTLAKSKPAQTSGFSLRGGK